MARQKDAKRCFLADFRLSGNLAVGALNDAVDLCQPKAAAGAFGCEERLKNSIKGQFRYSDARFYLDGDGVTGTRS